MVEFLVHFLVEVVSEVAVVRVINVRIRLWLVLIWSLLINIWIDHRRISWLIWSILIPLIMVTIDRRSSNSLLLHRLTLQSILLLVSLYQLLVESGISFCLFLALEIVLSYTLSFMFLSVLFLLDVENLVFLYHL